MTTLKTLAAGITLSLCALSGFARAEELTPVTVATTWYAQPGFFPRGSHRRACRVFMHWF